MHEGMVAALADDAVRTCGCPVKAVPQSPSNATLAVLGSTAASSVNGGRGNRFGIQVSPAPTAEMWAPTRRHSGRTPPRARQHEQGPPCLSCPPAQRGNSATMPLAGHPVHTAHQARRMHLQEQRAPRRRTRRRQRRHRPLRSPPPSRGRHRTCSPGQSSQSEDRVAGQPSSSSRLVASLTREFPFREYSESPKTLRGNHSARRNPESPDLDLSLGRASRYPHPKLLPP